MLPRFDENTIKVIKAILKKLGQILGVFIIATILVFVLIAVTLFFYRNYFSGLEYYAPASIKEWIYRCAKNRNNVFCTEAFKLTRKMDEPIILIYPPEKFNGQPTYEYRPFPRLGNRLGQRVRQFVDARDISLTNLVKNHIFLGKQLKTGVHTYTSLSGKKTSVKCVEIHESQYCKVGGLVTVFRTIDTDGTRYDILNEEDLKEKLDLFGGIRAVDSKYKANLHYGFLISEE